ncbi:MAG: hypothetical protein PHF66_13995 [Desulfobacteraceae bacterium]|jgi:hypothetical protein|nr:hypothetical protein [Desulfobacteraceae bacterium]
MSVLHYRLNRIRRNRFALTAARKMISLALWITEEFVVRKWMPEQVGRYRVIDLLTVWNEELLQ